MNTAARENYNPTRYCSTAEDLSINLPIPANYRALLAIQNMPALLVAAALSRLAVRMFSLAIVLYALERFHSPVLAGWIGFASVVPGLVVSPIAGAALDRVGPVFAIVIDMAVSTVLMLAMIVADALGLASPVVLMALVALYSLTNPLSRSGIRTGNTATRYLLLKTLRR